ncbi:peptidyl-alpha-hydroxyglycine alpha-amidating lyase family protein [Ereboglobus luteus]|uniref:6-bladed beta-propeller n=1 Tax=Ereboglobus luteus TaxID=1796921 RepID=A0A2U8E524_9BACT|nr:peptidyl-alpha-hydroxyglycine alpha-amidating lyase family protein [Ereboglobus luteus]AWI09951.1 hypothetical protein CKA38_12465 [Ereboglobus luteus]
MSETTTAIGQIYQNARIVDGSKWPRLNYKPDPLWPRLPDNTTFEETPGIAVDSREHAYVFHRGENPLMEFAPDGTLRRAWGNRMFVWPHSVKLDPEGNIWAVDGGGHMIVKIDPAGQVRMVLGRKQTPGETEENFNQPTDVGFGPHGDIYVTDGYGNSRVVRYTKEGRFINAWGRKGTGPGEFDMPHSVVVDRTGRVYIGDRENYRIQVFTREGEYITQWDQYGSPWGMCITPDDYLFMCDGHANRVVKLTLDGKLEGTFGVPGKMPGEFGYAHQIAVAPSGNIYIAEIVNWRVQKFIPR